MTAAERSEASSIARRQDANYTQKVARVHWNAAERCALYTAINVFCAKFGIQNFGFATECKLSTKQLQIMADAVNAVSNPSGLDPRGIDAVRGQITSARNKSPPKNKAVFDLLAKGTDFRARMSGGEAIPETERKPKTATPLSEFPVGPSVAATPPLTPDSKKRKRAAVVEETELSSSELSSPVLSEFGGDRSVRKDTGTTTGEKIEPGGWGQAVGGGEGASTIEEGPQGLASWLLRVGTSLYSS